MRYLRHATLALLLAYASFTAARLLFYIFQAQNFDSATNTELLVAFCAGLLLDTPPIFYYHLLFLILVLLPLPAKNQGWYRITVLWSFIIPSGIALQQNLADTVYYSYAKKRTGKEVFELLGHSKNILLDYLVDFWIVPLLMIPLVWLLYFFYKKINWPTTEWNRRTFVQHSILFLACIPLVILGLRGGLFLKPLTAVDAGKFVNPTLTSLSVSTPMQLISTIDKKGIPQYQFYQEAEARKVIKPIKHFSSVADSMKLPKGTNVVILIVESLDQEYMGYFNHGIGYTPFLDSLCNAALTFKHAYAAGTTSMDAPPAILSSIPHWMSDSYIRSSYNTNSIESIGSLLKPLGYSAAFYHGGENGTMNFNSFVAGAGAGKYFGKNEYPVKSHDDGAWGIPDEPYLQYFAEELNKQKQPFVYTLFTLSSHHPYFVPDKYKNTLPVGTMPIHQAIAYTDLSLRKFFQSISTKAWYKNTLFVITADHASVTENAYYNTSEGDYTIPLIFFHPNQKLNADTSITVSQTDITPSILQLLGFDKPFYSLGNSVFDSTAAHISIMHNNGQYQVIEWPWLYKTNLNDEVLVYNLLSDHYQKRSISNPQVLQRLDQYLKSSLQVYATDLRQNTLRTKKVENKSKQRDKKISR